MNNEWVLGNKLFIADRHIQHLSNMIYALQTFVLNNISKDNEEITLLSDQINKMEIEYKKCISFIDNYTEEDKNEK